MNELGKTLKQLRGKRSLRDIADKTGLSHTYIADIENGYRRGSKKPIHPTPETLKKLSKALDASYGELMVLAGYWGKNEEYDDLLTEIYNEEAALEKVILKVLKRVVNDDNLFPSKFHKQIFEIFGGYASDADRYKWSSFTSTSEFDEWYTDYLVRHEDEITESDEKMAIDEFNIYYNYNSVKQGLLTLDRFLNRKKEIDDFYREVVRFCEENDIGIQDIITDKSPISNPEKEPLTEKEFDILEALKNSKIVTFDEKVLTEEQRQMVIKLTQAILGD